MTRYDSEFLKRNFLNHNASYLLLEALAFKSNDFYKYIERFTILNIYEYEVDDNALKMIDNARNRYKDTNGNYNQNYEFIWYKGKFAHYCYEIITVINLVNNKIYQNSQNEEIRSICNSIASKNVVEKLFFMKFSSIYTRSIAFLAGLPDAINNYPEVEQFSRDLHMIEKRYFSYCLSYSQLMSKIYLLQ